MFRFQSIIVPYFTNQHAGRFVAEAQIICILILNQNFQPSGLLSQKAKSTVFFNADFHHLINV